MRILPTFSGITLFVLVQMSFPDANAHHFAHFSNTHSVVLKGTSKNSRKCDFSPIGAGVIVDKHEAFRGSLNPVRPMTTVADTLLFCTAMGNAELPASNQIYLGEGHPDASSCSAHIWSTQTVNDPCGGDVTYDVRLFPFDGVDFIQVVNATTIPLDLNNQAILNFDTRASSLSPDHEIALHGVPYTSGSCSPVSSQHRLIWTVVNDCDETTTYEYLIRVEDCEKPRPICTGLNFISVTSSGDITLWAKDFILGSNDDCTSYDDIAYSFSGESYQPSRYYSCPGVCFQGVPQLIEIWIGDGGRDLNCDGNISWSERNKDSCTTLVNFQDNIQSCECEPIHVGWVRTPLGKGISDVIVNLYSPFDDLIDQATTDQDGFYEFPFQVINPLLGYRFEPVKNDNHKNGVSTFDLVLLQKHLLNLMPFDSPFEYIAADANNSASVSALDVIEIRKLIIGLYTEFPKSDSWRFVPEHFQFLNPSDPWPFPGDTVTSTFDGLPNFIGVKVGDIHSANNFTTIEVRNAPEVLSLFIEDQLVTAGDFVEVSVFTENISGLLGMQFTMQTPGLEYEGVQPGLMKLSAEGIANHQDAIALSWAEISPVSSDKPQPLFTLLFKAKTDGHLHEMLDLSSSVTKSEAYREADNQSEEGIEVMDVQLAFGSHSARAQSIGYKLYQNTPNPFSEQVKIAFELPMAMSVVITVYDVHGRVIRMTEGLFNHGYNEIELNGKELGVPGVYYYRLSAGDFTASRKCILAQD